MYLPIHSAFHISHQMLVYVYACLKLRALFLSKRPYTLRITWYGGRGVGFVVFVCDFNPHGIPFRTTPGTPLICTHIAPATSQTIDLISDPVHRGLCHGAYHVKFAP